MRAAQQGLEGAGEVDEAVADEEEHGDDGRHVVDLGDDDAHLGDADGQGDCRDGLAFVRHVGEAPQDGEDVVPGDGLQKPGCRCACRAGVRVNREGDRQACVYTRA